MSGPQFVHKLAPVGVTVFGAIAVIIDIGIAAAPAKAGSLQWADGASSFFDEVNPVAGDTFSVTFSPDNLTFVGTANGEFASPFPVAPPPFAQSADPALGNFEFVSFLPPVDDVVQEFKYKLTNDLVFDYNNGIVVTYGAGSLFQGEFDVPIDGGPIQGVEFEEIEIMNTTVVTPRQTYNLGDPDFPVTGTAFVFEDILDGATGYSGSVSVKVAEIPELPPGPLAEIPEPTTILGLLAVGGLGLSLKCKKQVS